MELCYKEFKDEVDELVEFLTSESWDFFGTQNPKPESIRKNFKNKVYNGDESKTFWVISDNGTKVGMLRIFDLQDPIPLVEIRILSKFRGRGIGAAAINWLVDYVFRNFPDKQKIEGYTRQDNYAMRCTFHKCLFAREAHHRKTWREQSGKLLDSIGYGITREDWEKGEITTLEWDDFKY